MIEYTELEYKIAEEDYLEVLTALKKRLDYTVEKGYTNSEKLLQRNTELARLFGYHKTARSIINALEEEVKLAYQKGLKRGKELNKEKKETTPVAWRSMISLIGHQPIAKLMSSDLQLYLLNPKTNSKEAKRKACIAKARQEFPQLY